MHNKVNNKYIRTKNYGIYVRVCIYIAVHTCMDVAELIVNNTFSM
jgi:hypothetical protein